MFRSMKKKVLVIISNFQIGGIEKTLLQCLPFLKINGIQIDICCFDNSGPLLEAYEKYIGKIYKITKTHSIIFDAYQLNSILTKEKYDIVHSRISFCSGGWCLICWLKRIPIIVSLHNVRESLLLKNRTLITSIIFNIYLLIHKFLAKSFASHIIGHSKAILNSYNKKWTKNKKYSVIYNGFHFKNDSLTEPDSFQFDYKFKYLLHIGSFRHQKNHKLLIDVFENICKLQQNVKLILLGEGIFKDEIIKTVKKKGLENDVYFLGTKNNIGFYYTHSDLFIFPSIHEGLGNVIIEAQYFELPIMASNIPPHLEVLSSLQYSHLFNLKTPPPKIAQLALDIINSKKEYLSQSKEFVIKNFSIERMVDNLRILYNSF